MKLTGKTVDKVMLPAGKADHIEWCDELPGFGCRIRGGGSKTLVFQYKLGNKNRRVTLGAATEEAFRTVKDRDGIVTKLGVRERVADLQARVRLGEDPAGEKVEKRARAAETFAAVGKRFLADRNSEVRSGYWLELERHIVLHGKPLGELQFATIDQRTIATRLNEIKTGSSPGVANAVRTTLSTLWTWAIRQGITTVNPIAGTAKSPTASREYVPSDDELLAIWTQAGDDHYGCIVRLLMLTGAREDEIGSLRRSEVGKAEVPAARRDGYDLPAFTVDIIDLPAERTKSGKPHVVPLSAPALAILRAQPLRAGAGGEVRDLYFGMAEGGFSGWSNSKERLDGRVIGALRKVGEGRGDQKLLVRLARVEDLKVRIRKAKPKSQEQKDLQKQLGKIWWRVHDLRRAIDTTMGDRLGILPHVADACLGHTGSLKSGKSGVAGVYNKAAYLRERTEALKLWAEHLAALLDENRASLQAAE